MKIPISKLKKALRQFFDSREVLDVAAKGVQTAGARKQFIKKNFDEVWNKYRGENSYKYANEIVGESMEAGAEKAEIYSAVDAFTEGDVRKISNISKQLGYSEDKLSGLLKKGQMSKVKKELSSLAENKAQKQAANVFEEDILAMTVGDDSYVKRARAMSFNKNLNQEEYIDSLVESRKQYTDKAIKRNPEGLEKSLKALAGEEKSSKIIQEAKEEATTSAFNNRKYIGELIKVKKSLQDTISNEVGYARKTKGLFAIAGDYLTDTPTKLDRAIREFSKSGELGVSQNIRQLFRLHKTARTMSGYGQSIGNKLTRVLSEMDDGGMRIRQYVEMKDPKRFVYNAKKRLSFDKPLADDLGMTEAEIRIANKANNFFRSAAKTHVDISTRGDFSLSNMAKSWDELPSDRVTDLDYIGKGDYGHNYWHAKPTEEYFEKNLKNNRSFLQATQKDDYNVNTQIFYGRKGESGLRADYANRVTPAEEVETYSNQFFRQQPYRMGKHLLNQTKMTLAIPKRQVAGRFDDKLKDLNSIEKDWDNMFRKSKSFEEMSKPEKFYNEFVNISIPAALSSPMMWTMNMVQPLFTTAPSKGFLRTASQLARTNSKFVKEVVLNKGRVNDAFGDLWKGAVPGRANRQQLAQHKISKEFRDKNPDIFSTPAESLMKHSSIVSKDNKLYGKYRKFINEATKYALMPFKATDMLSRHATLSSAVGHADDLLQKTFNDIKAGKISPQKARSDLERNLHLREFDTVTREDIVKNMPLNNVKSAKSYEDWFSQHEVQNMMYDYAEASVFTEIFDYSNFGRQSVMNALKSKSPLLAKTFTFRSWPLYYTKLLKSQVDEAVTGIANKDYRLVEPLAKTAAIGFGAYGLGSHAATSDDDFVNEFGRYVQGRVPFLSPLGFVSGITTQPAGMLDPAVGLGLYLPAKGMQELGQAVQGMTGSEMEGMSSVDFIERIGHKKMKKTPLLYRGEAFFETLKDIEEELR